MASIIMYKTHSCPYCKMEGEYLKEKGFEFEEVYIDDDASKAQEMMDKSGQLGVPFTLIVADDGTEFKINGFNKKKINDALGISE